MALLWLRRLLADRTGASLVEFSLVFPVFASVSLGTVDLGYLLYQWNAAAKATHLGARYAIVNDPVAKGLNDLTAEWKLDKYAESMGLSCTDMSNGTTAGVCPDPVTVRCVPSASSGSCSGSYAFNETAFAAIFARMQIAYPGLKRENVRIEYVTSGLGFVGRPGGLPVEVRVSIACQTQDFFFLYGLANLIAPTPTGECANGAPGWPVPPSTTSYVSEDFSSKPAT